MKPLACLILLALCACTPIADPYTQAAWASGAINATQIAVVERAQIATIDAASTSSALVVQQTQAAMYATATQQEQAAQGTQIAAQHTAVMDALKATQDRYVLGLQQDERYRQEFAKQTQHSLVATATQGAIANATRVRSNMTDVIVYLVWSLSCLVTLAMAALIAYKWLYAVRQLDRLVYLPRPTAPTITQIAPVVPQSDTTVDTTANEIGKIILRSAYLNGWDSDQIAGFRDAEIGGGKWHRLISAIRDHVQTDRTGTRLIDGTLREFYAELNAGNIRIDI